MVKKERQHAKANRLANKKEEKEIKDKNTATKTEQLERQNQTAKPPVMNKTDMVKGNNAKCQPALTTSVSNRLGLLCDEIRKDATLMNLVRMYCDDVPSDIVTPTEISNPPMSRRKKRALRRNHPQRGM